MLDEMIMLGLRSKGINLDEINSYSKEWYIKNKNIISSFIKDSYLIENNSILKCTPKGYIFCDELVNKLL